MRYTLEEIDQMRADIRQTLAWSYACGVADLERITEERLRTYMANGTTAEELREHVRAESQRRWEAAAEHGRVRA